MKLDYWIHRANHSQSLTDLCNLKRSSIMQPVSDLQFSRSSNLSCCSALPVYPLHPPGCNASSFMVPPTFKSLAKVIKFGPLKTNASQSDFILGEDSSHQTCQQEGDFIPSYPNAPEATLQDWKAHGEVEEDGVLRSILNLALPAVGAVLSDPIMSLIDTGCVGQVSSIQLAALGPNTSIFNFVFQLFTFLGAATCNLLASVGLRASTLEEQKTQQHQASQLLSHAFLLAVAFGLVLIVLMETFAPQLLALMGTGKDYFEPALIYLRVRALSAPAVLVLIVGQGACLGRQDARTPLRINTMAAAFNLAGDILFTLSLGWGVAGAAWATLISQCIAVVLLVRALTSMSVKTSQEGSNTSQPLPLQVGWYGLPTLEVLGPFLSMAGPLVVRCALGMTVYTLTAKGAAALGTLSVAAHQVALQVFWTLSYFPESLSIAAQALVARNVKAKPKRARDLARMLLGFGTGLGVILMGMVASAHYFGASWLTADQNVRQLVQSVTLQSMVCELLCAIVIVIEGIAIASGDFAYLPKMQFLNLGLVLLALGLTLRQKWGLGGIWWCLVLYFGFRLVYHTFYIGCNWTTHEFRGASIWYLINSLMAGFSCVMFAMVGTLWVRSYYYAGVGSWTIAATREELEAFVLN